MIELETEEQAEQLVTAAQAVSLIADADEEAIDPEGFRRRRDRERRRGKSLALVCALAGLGASAPRPEPVRRAAPARPRQRSSHRAAGG